MGYLQFVTLFGLLSPSILAFQKSNHRHAKAILPLSTSDGRSAGGTARQECHHDMIGVAEPRRLGSNPRFRLYSSTQDGDATLAGGKKAEGGRGEDDPFQMAKARFPTSVDDQVRQAVTAIQASRDDGLHRHSVRLLLPLIGATELDDWPGGARQQMEAAAPLMESILIQSRGGRRSGDVPVRESVIDESDGVRALFAQAEDPKMDACAILLPSAETVPKVQSLDEQVGPTRDLVVVNAQWRRRSDFPFFGGKEQARYAEETFQPTYVCTSLMVEGEQIRILRAYPGPWRVFLMVFDDEDALMRGSVDWKEIGAKPAVEVYDSLSSSSPSSSPSSSELFNFGRPTYKEIEVMITSQEDYVAKTLTERAASAFKFIKDTL